MANNKYVSCLTEDERKYMDEVFSCWIKGFIHPNELREMEESRKKSREQGDN